MSSEKPYPDYSLTKGDYKGIITYYSLAFAIAWIVWVPLIFSSRGWLPFRIPESTAWLAGLAPIFGGVFTTYRELGLQGVRNLIARCFMWKFTFRWWLITFLLPILLILLNLLFYHTLGGSIHGVRVKDWLSGYLSALPILIPLALFEEAGWRGYASPRLRYLLGEFGGNLVLGVLWGLWHIPYYLIRGVSFFADFSPLYIWLSLGFFVLGTAGFEMLMSWVFRHTKGSLLFACIFHASNNAFANLSFVPTAKAENGLIFVSSAVVGWIVVFAILGAEKKWVANASRHNVGR